MNLRIRDSEVCFFLFFWWVEKFQYHFLFVFLFLIFFFFGFCSGMLNLFKWCGCFHIFIDFIGQILLFFALIHLILTLSSFSFHWACHPKSTSGHLWFFLVCWMPNRSRNQYLRFLLTLELDYENLWFILDQLLF